MIKQFKSNDIKVYPSSHRSLDSTSDKISSDNIENLTNNVVDNTDQNLPKYLSSKNEIMINRNSQSGLQETDSTIITDFQNFMSTNFIVDDLTLSGTSEQDIDTILEINYLNGEHLSLDLSKVIKSDAQLATTLTILYKGFLPNISEITELKIPNCIETIEEGALSGIGNLTTLTIPFVGGRLEAAQDETSLFGYIFGDTPFTNGDVVEQVYQKSGDSTTYKKSYYVPHDLGEVTVNSGYLRYGAFSCNKNDEQMHINKITVLNIHNNIVGWRAFYNIKSLHSVTLPDGITEIGGSAFAYCNTLYRVYLPNSVRRINESAFNGCVHLNETSIPAQLERIDSSAFYNCKEINNITLPDTLTWIGKYAFYNCIALTKINIPENVNTIGQRAFFHCTALEEIIYAAKQVSYFLDTNFTEMDCQIFNDCGKNIISGVGGITFTFTNTVQKIPNYLLYTEQVDEYNKIARIKSIIINSEVTQIGEGAFLNCSYIKTIEIPKSVNQIGFNCLGMCNDLQSITIPYIGDNVDNPTYTNFGFLFGAETYSTNLSYVPRSLIEVTITEDYDIPSHAFASCTGLQIINVPRTIRNIGSSAFYNCKALQTFKLPELIDTIWSSTFYMCVSLTSIIIPLNVTLIGMAAFAYCNSLTSVVIPNSVTIVNQSAFYSCSNLERVTISSNVTTLSPSLFYNCPNLQYVNILGNVTEIGYRAFTMCTSLRTLNLPSSLVTIGNQVFSGCTSLEEISIPESVTFIDYSAFDSCSSLNFVTIKSSSIYNSITKSSSHGSLINYADVILVPTSITGTSPYLDKSTISTTGTSAGSYVYKKINSFSADNTTYKSYMKIYTYDSGTETKFSYSKDANNEVTVKAKNADITSEVSGLKIPPVINWSGTLYVVTRVGTNGFEGCDNLVKVTLPASLSKIGHGEVGVRNFAFQDCKNLRRIIIPHNIEMVSEVFFGCNSLNDIIYPQKILVASSTFNSCISLKNITIPSSVTSIGYAAFQQCSGLELIDLGVSSVGSIRFDVFENCTNLREIVLPYTLTEIGNSCFNNCESLEKVYYIGTETSWNAISIGEDNDNLQNATIYYYRPTPPYLPGNYWRYVNGLPVVWGDPEWGNVVTFLPRASSDTTTNNAWSIYMPTGGNPLSGGSSSGSGGGYSGGGAGGGGMGTW